MTGQSDKKPRRILLGKIATAHGVRGLLKVLVFAEDPRSLEQYGPLFTSGDGDKTIALKMKNSLGGKGTKFWLAAVEGLADRTAAEKLRGTELWLNREKLPAITKDNEFYIEDLIGLIVRDSEGKNIGTVAGVQNFGAGDLLDIQPQGSESFYLPFTREHILSTDIGNRVLTVQIPAGLND